MSARPLKLGRIVGTRRTLALSDEMRKDTHVHVPGSSGTGKSKFLEYLICQDILERRGVCLLDPHGSLARNVLDYVSRLIFPPKHFYYIQPSSDEWTCVYNPLNKLTDDDWYVSETIKDAVLKCWGQTNALDTPLLDQWLKTALFTGVHLGLTLPELGMLLEAGADRNAQRQAVIERLPELETTMRSRWKHLCHLAEKKPVDFMQETGAASRRLSKFVENPRLARMYGVPDVSLNLSRLMDENAVVIFDLSPGGRFTREDAYLFGTFLLTDIYIQMTNRQHPERRCYVYIDEFQRFKAPDLSALLDECRKCGITFTLAHQRPGQLKSSDSVEDRDVYSAVMTNARHKIVFGGVSPEELRPLAELLALGIFDPKKVKDEIWTKSVLAYQKEYWEAHGHSHSTGRVSSSGGSTGSGSTSGTGFTSASGATYDPNSGLFTPAMLHTTESNAWASQYGSSEFSGESWANADIDSDADSTVRFPVLVPQMGEQLSARYYYTPEEQMLQMTAILYDQLQRQAVVKIAGQKEPIPIEVPFVQTPKASAQQRERQRALGYKAANWFLPASDAANLVEQRKRAFLAIGQPIHNPSPETNATIEDTPPMSSFSPDEISIKVDDVTLNARDIAILKDVFENRFITIKHAMALHWPNVSSDTAVKRRLRQLADVDLLKPQPVNAEGCKVIYRLTKNCVDLLTEHGFVSELVRDGWSGKMRSRYTDPIAPGHLPHELKLYDLKAALQPAIDGHPQLATVEFAIWPLPFAFEVMYNGKRSSQRPDGFLHVHYHPSPDQSPISNYFFIEFDHRRTETRDTIVQKLQKYRLYLDHGFGHFIGKPDAPKSDRSFRVLIVVQTADSRKRRDNICASLAGAGIGTLAYVTAFQELVAAPLGAIWLTPKHFADNPQTASLVPLFPELSK